MKAIFELQGKQSIRKIAETLGISRNTVRRYLRDPDGALARKPRPRRPSKLDPYKEYIMHRLGEGVDNCVALLREIRQQGYTGGYTILKDFVRAHHLLEDLRQAQAERRLDRPMRVYLSPKVLIIDEFGVWPYDRTAATALFALISARYEKGASVILTSNKAFAEWGEVLSDAVIATAILDRLLHHSHVLNIRGESYRLREKRQAGLFSGVLSAKEVTPPATTTNNSSS